MEKLKKCLKDLSVFARLNEDEIRLVCERAYEKQYEEGEIIFFENDSPRKLYLLASGRVKLSMLSQEGKEKVLTILQGGDILGEISLFDQDPHPLTAEVMEAARLMVIPWEDLESIIMENPGLAIKIIKALTKKTRLLTSQVRGLVFQDTEGRLASLLNRFSRDFGVEVKSGTMIELILTHQEIANLLGASRVTVTKLLNKFRDEGIIKLYKRKIVIMEEEELADRVEALY